MAKVTPNKSSHPAVFCRKGVVRTDAATKVVLENFAKFTGKHLCLRPATLLKKRLLYKCFPLNFAKFSRTSLVAAPDLI